MRRPNRGRPFRQRPTTHLFPNYFAALEKAGKKMGVNGVDLYRTTLEAFNKNAEIAFQVIKEEK